MAYKRLTEIEWATVEKMSADGESNRSLATKFGVSEGAIRKRFAGISPLKVEAAARNIVLAAKSINDLPPSGQVRAFALAEVWQSISQSMAMSAEQGAALSLTLSAIANNRANQLDAADPDREELKLIHGLIETSNKAAYQPVELLKANKEAIADQVEGGNVVDPDTYSDSELAAIIQDSHG